MEQMIREYFLGTARIAEGMIAHSTKINAIGELLIERLGEGKKILVCGNGGSASQSSHLVGELVGRFEKVRKGLPCISLSSDNAFTTAWTNDCDFESLYERGVESYGSSGDVLIVLSTSGNSGNVMRALKKAGDIGMTTVALLGRDGGEIGKSEIADHHIIVSHDITAHIQDVHLMTIHVLCRMIERRLFPDE